MTQSIVTPVGPNCANRSPDVLIVQTLLNQIPVASGGLGVKLKTDGLCGTNTARAIANFQKRQFGWADGVVAPGQMTLQRLNLLAGEGRDDVVPAVQRVIALLTYHLHLRPAMPRTYAMLSPLSARLRCLKIALANYQGFDTALPGVRTAAGVLPIPSPIPDVPVPLAAGPGAVLVLLLFLLFVIRSRPAVMPKSDADKALERELTILEQLVMQASKEDAERERTRVRAENKSLEDCAARRLERIVVGGTCAELYELYRRILAELLKKLTQIITGGSNFPLLQRTVNELLLRHDDVLKKLRSCLECDKLPKN